VLDEPTVALDVSARREFWTTLRAVAAEGKTVIFATHYLEEADANADRVVLMAHGRVVADGSTSEIKARAAHRTIRATLPEVPESELRIVPGVNTAERHGETVILRCNDSDAAIRALIAAYPQACDLEIQGAALEDAFIELTTELEAEDDDHVMEAAR
jgi:ABC-2 type transport system ATP-binding protein